jgi:hypothetical protein
MLTQAGVTLSIQWGLPVLLLIAGASAWLSLTHRSGRQFFAERVFHLLVPFIVCVLTVIPITLYLAALTGSDSHVPFLQFYADYFRATASYSVGILLINSYPSGTISGSSL